jgi:hypothetical protein
VTFGKHTAHPSIGEVKGWLSDGGNTTLVHTRRVGYVIDWLDKNGIAALSTSATGSPNVVVLSEKDFVRVLLLVGDELADDGLDRPKVTVSPVTHGPVAEESRVTLCFQTKGVYLWAVAHASVPVSNMGFEGVGSDRKIELRNWNPRTHVAPWIGEAKETT